MSHTGGGGVRKVPKKCHVLFEWPLIYFNVVGKGWATIFVRGPHFAFLGDAGKIPVKEANIKLKIWSSPGRMLPPPVV
jgi:hypothetical protein